MARINCIPPSELVDKHLIAEYRELPRIFALVKKSQDKGLLSEDIDINDHYILGTGHVKFFYDKLQYLMKRQSMLIEEMRKRGFKPNFVNIEELMKGINQVWYNDWEPDDNAMQINRERIAERLK